MLSTATAIIATVGLLMPGFIIAEQTPRLVGGIYGRRSAVGQTPSPHDVYLEDLCTVTVDEQGIRSLASRVSPPQGVYIAAAQIARIDLLPPEASTTIESLASQNTFACRRARSAH